MRSHLKQTIATFPVLFAQASGANALEEFKISELIFTPKLELGAGYVYNSDQAFGSNVS